MSGDPAGTGFGLRDEATCRHGLPQGRLGRLDALVDQGIDAFG
jgi:hypothetical protein